MNATLKDIATRAHCSPATVSRAINGTAGVNSALLERIHAAMAELEARSASAAPVNATIVLASRSATRPPRVCGSGATAKTSTAGYVRRSPRSRMRASESTE